MTYCMFENTLRDLYQLRDRLREVGSMEELLEDASEQEADAMRSLPNVLAEMLSFYDNLNDE